jgi:exonuclease SbcC
VLREQHRAVNEKQRQLDDLHNRLHQTQRDLTDIAEAMSEARQKITEYQTVLARRAEIETGLQQLQAARETAQDWDRRLHQSAQLSERKHQLDAALAAARAAVEGKLSAAQARLDMLKPRAAAMPALQNRLAEAQAELAALQTTEQTRENLRLALANLDTETARLEEQNKQLKVEMQEIKTNLDQLAQAGSQCPVCQRPLDESHQAQVLAQFKQEGTVKGDIFRANQTRLRQVVAERQDLDRQLAEADQLLRKLAAGQTQVARLGQSLHEAESSAAELETVQKEHGGLKQQLDTQAYAADMLMNLAEIETELAALGYNRTAHTQARAQIDTLSNFEAQSHTLGEAGKRIKEEEKRLERETARHTRLLEQTAADRERIAQLKQDTAALPQLSAKLNRAGDDVNRLQREERFAREKVIAVQQNLAHIAYQAKKRGELEDQLQQVRESLGLYRELQQAFGKKGVQALLIESAIPEIEDEANLLLNRMTASRMHVRFETQREAKSTDNTIETLDIRISDELGTRDYELYSGGEAFRVNFAIRIAMSKVLARRAPANPGD